MMTTKQLADAAAALALLAAATADPETLDDADDASAVEYVARLVHYGAIVAAGK